VLHRRIAPREVLAGFDTCHNTPPFKSRHHPNSRITPLKLATIRNRLALELVPFFLVFCDERGQHGWVQQFGFEPDENPRFHVGPLDKCTVATRPFVAGRGAAIFSFCSSAYRIRYNTHTSTILKTDTLCGGTC
ncbi:MAG: hypothetical protein ACI9PU_000854, partial [Ascidiaceihabitans sp.]